MSTDKFCDPCDAEGKSLTSVRYCSDCEEHLCKECADSHLRFKAFRSHHLIDISKTGSKVLQPQKRFCESHDNVPLDYYCNQHDDVCCRACIPVTHRKCENVLPLETASKDVKTSSLLGDTLQEFQTIVQTLNDLFQDRNENIQLVNDTKVSITQQISRVKSGLCLVLDKLEQKLLKDLNEVTSKNESKLLTEKSQILDLKVAITDKQQELEFLKENGSNNQLFLALRQYMNKLGETECQVQSMISNFKEVEIKYEETQNIIDSIGSVRELFQSCGVQYKSPKLPQAQVQPNSPAILTNFKNVGRLNLQLTADSSFYDLVVNKDNALFLCDFVNGTLHKYKKCKYLEKSLKLSSNTYGVTIIPGTSTAVVTLPFRNSINFIDTTHMKITKTAVLGIQCYGISASTDKIFVGGTGTIQILDTVGSCLSNISVKDIKITIFYLKYLERNERILYRGEGRLGCITLDGTVDFHHNIDGRFISGLTIDKHEYVYTADGSAIERFAADGAFKDVILTISRPHGMTFNNDSTKLYIIRNEGKSVQIYNCK